MLVLTEMTLETYLSKLSDDKERDLLKDEDLPKTRNETLREPTELLKGYNSTASCFSGRLT